MRISDWSSDVCSSDLRAFPETDTARSAEGRRQGVSVQHGVVSHRRFRIWLRCCRHHPGWREWHRQNDPDRSNFPGGGVFVAGRQAGTQEIGRASWWERVWQYVSVTVGAVPIKKKKIQKKT